MPTTKRQRWRYDAILYTRVCVQTKCWLNFVDPSPWFFWAKAIIVRQIIFLLIFRVGNFLFVFWKFSLHFASVLAKLFAEKQVCKVKIGKLLFGKVINWILKPEKIIPIIDVDYGLKWNCEVVHQSSKVLPLILKKILFLTRAGKRKALEGN
jgi:hypothetical protein